MGLGAVGRGVARRLAGFGARIVVCDPHVPPEQVILAGAEAVCLEELLERVAPRASAPANVVATTCSATPHTPPLGSKCTGVCSRSQRKCACGSAA